MVVDKMISILAIAFYFEGISRTISTCSSSLQHGFATAEFCSNTTVTSTNGIALDSSSTSDTPGTCTCEGQVEFLQHEGSKHGIAISEFISSPLSANTGCGTTLNYHSTTQSKSMGCVQRSRIMFWKDNTFIIVLNKTQPPYKANSCTEFVIVDRPKKLTLTCFSANSTALLTTTPSGAQTKSSVYLIEASTPTITPKILVSEAVSSTSLVKSIMFKTTAKSNMPEASTSASGTYFKITNTVSDVIANPSFKGIVMGSEKRDSFGNNGVAVLSAISTFQFFVILILAVHVIKLRYHKSKLSTTLKTSLHDNVDASNSDSTNSTALTSNTNQDKKNEDNHDDAVITV